MGVTSYDIEGAGGRRGTATRSRRGWADVRAVGEKLGWGVVVMWAVATITFFLSHAIAATPAAYLAGSNASQASIRRIDAQLGLDKPLVVQYGDYMWKLLHGTMGHSVVTGGSVGHDIVTFLPVTLGLLIPSFVIYFLLATGLGVVTAYYKNSVLDRVLRLGAVIGTGAPVFWVGLVLQFIFYAKLHVLPLSGQLSAAATPPPTVTGVAWFDALLAGQFGTFFQALQYLVLPCAVVVMSLLALGLRLMRSAMVEEMGRPYVLGARGRGLNERRVVLNHALRNALTPFLTMTSIQFGYMITYVVLVEVVFKWPGIGWYSYQALQALDYAPLVGVAIVVTAVFIVGNVLAEVAVAWLDPRARPAP